MAHVKVDSYVSTYTADRKKACYGFLTAARKLCDASATWADYTEGKANVRPNPGNKSHIAIIECWEEYGSTVYVAQSASSKHGVDYDRIYKIIEAPKSTDPAKAIPAYSATG